MKKGNFVKKILLDGRLDRYKANLHCHTVLSDGKKTPEQIKKDYLAHGYSIVAFTDHDKYYPHNDLTDDRFIALTALIWNTTALPGAARPATSALSRRTRRTEPWAILKRSRPSS